MKTDNDRTTAMLERIVFEMCRRSEICEATIARFESSLEKANDIRQQQKAMSKALDRLEATKQ